MFLWWIIIMITFQLRNGNDISKYFSQFSVSFVLLHISSIFESKTMTKMVITKTLVVYGILLQLTTLLYQHFRLKRTTCSTLTSKGLQMPLKVEVIMWCQWHVYGHRGIVWSWGFWHGPLCNLQFSHSSQIVQNVSVHYLYRSITWQVTIPTMLYK